jgi:hypothetical protein
MQNYTPEGGREAHVKFKIKKLLNNFCLPIGRKTFLIETLIFDF